MDGETPLPGLEASFFTERDGVIALAHAVNKLRHIWRETPLADIGVDGQIEHLTEAGRPTALLVAVQVKSGDSYFEEVRNGHVIYRPKPKHRNYWSAFPIPVIVVLHRPATGELIWIDATRYFKDLEPGEKALRISLSQRLDIADRDAIFVNCGPQAKVLLEPNQLLPTMAREATRNAAFEVSYLELFLNGLTALARKLYFGMDLCWEIAESKLEDAGAEFGVGLGPSEYLFLDRYVRFLVEQRLVTMDFAHYLHEVEHLELQNSFILPLTPRGRSLVEYVGSLQDGLTEERLVGMHFLPRNYELMRSVGEFRKSIITP